MEGRSPKTNYYNCDTERPSNALVTPCIKNTRKSNRESANMILAYPGCAGESGSAARAWSKWCRSRERDETRSGHEAHGVRRCDGDAVGGGCERCRMELWVPLLLCKCVLLNAVAIV